MKVASQERMLIIYRQACSLVFSSYAVFAADVMVLVVIILLI